MGGCITYNGTKASNYNSLNELSPLQKKRKKKEKKEEEPHLNLDCILTMASSTEGTLFLKDDHCVYVKLIPEFPPKLINMQVIV